MGVFFGFTNDSDGAFGSFGRWKNRGLFGIDIFGERAASDFFLVDKWWSRGAKEAFVGEAMGFGGGFRSGFGGVANFDRFSGPESGFLGGFGSEMR